MEAGKHAGVRVAEVPSDQGVVAIGYVNGLSCVKALGRAEGGDGCESMVAKGVDQTRALCYTANHLVCFRC
jgi:hypothetical protein